MIDSVLLRPLPFPAPDQLVTLYNTYPRAGVERDGSSLPNYCERRGKIPALSQVSLLRYGTVIVGDAGTTERTDVMRVTPEFFSTLGVGVRLALGAQPQQIGGQFLSLGLHLLAAGSLWFLGEMCGARPESSSAD